MAMVKTFAARIKAAGTQDGLEEGQFEAIVSVFGNKDSYGDVVMPGAFVDTLQEWKASGDPIPVYYSHRMDDPDYNIGYVTDAKEVKADELGYPHPAGLWVRGQLDDEPGSKAAKVYRLMKGRRVTQFSFAYDVVDGGFAKRPLQVDGKDTDVEEEYYALRKLKLYEVGPTPIGANQDTDLLGIKHVLLGVANEVKAGRVLSAKNETAIRQAYDALGAVLSSLGDDGGKNGGTNTHADAAGGNAEDLATGNAEDHAEGSEPVDTKAGSATAQTPDLFARIAAL